jgi:pimeloyl-ACP methyl ester carboxylesterase
MDYLRRALSPYLRCPPIRGKSIPGVGHWVQQEAPEAVNAALEDFLDGLD